MNYRGFKKYSNQTSRMHCDMCNLCLGFLIDFISFPIEPPLSKHVNSKNISKVAHLLAKEFYRILKTITPLEEYFVAKKYLKSFHLVQHANNTISQEIIRGTIKLEALCELPHQDTINYIILILEENNIIKKADIQLLWIANCLEHFWMHLEQMHNEHTGKAPASYSGPPIGISPKKSSILDERTQEQKEFDELYN